MQGTAISHVVRRSVYRLCKHNNDNQPADVGLVADITNALTEAFLDNPPPIGFEDACSSNSDIAEVDMRHRAYRPSTDKPQPIWLHNGVVHLHHTHNAVLTKDCLNRMVGVVLKCALPCLKRAFEINETTPAITAGYHPDHQSFWKAFEMFADNERMIRGVWASWRNKPGLCINNTSTRFGL